MPAFLSYLTMPFSQTLINGVISTEIDHSDRGLAYGDGLFETLQVLDGIPCYWDLHLARLLKGCRRLKLNVDARTLSKSLYQDALQLLKDNHLPSATLKITLTRGVGPRGYGFEQNHKPTRICTLSESKAFPEHYHTQGIRLFRCQTTLAEQPLLAGIKHLNRLEQVLARSEWETDFQEGLMTTRSENVVEGVMSNVFLVKEGQLITPLLDNAGVEGIMKSRVLKWAELKQFNVQQRVISINELKQADHLFVCNSLIGTWPVREFDGQNYARFDLLDDFALWLESDQLSSRKSFSADINLLN